MVYVLIVSISSRYPLNSLSDRKSSPLRWRLMNNWKGQHVSSDVKNCILSLSLSLSLSAQSPAVTMPRLMAQAIHTHTLLSSLFFSLTNELLEALRLLERGNAQSPQALCQQGLCLSALCSLLSFLCGVFLGWTWASTPLQFSFGHGSPAPNTCLHWHASKSCFYTTVAYTQHKAWPAVWRTPD